MGHLNTFKAKMNVDSEYNFWSSKDSLKLLKLNVVQKCFLSLQYIKAWKGRWNISKLFDSKNINLTTQLTVSMQMTFLTILWQA